MSIRRSEELILTHYAVAGGVDPGRSGDDYLLNVVTCSYEKRGMSARSLACSTVIPPNVTCLIQIKKRVFVQIARLCDLRILELDVERFCIVEILDLHARKMAIFIG